MPSATKAKVLRKWAKLYDGRLVAYTIAAACDEWLHSRGLQNGTRENFNRWTTTTEQPERTNHES
jgi:hypothetical protein